MSPRASGQRFLPLGILAGLFASFFLWYVFHPGKPDPKCTKLLLELSKKEDEDEETEETPVSGEKSSSLSPPAKGTAGASMEAAPTPQISNVRSARTTTDLHHVIEEIDKKGKALFKSKKYLEAADAFTEALNLIADSHSEELTLSKQVATLTNNRSAMYEKADLPDLALHDCDLILDADPSHSKARTRKLRILESTQRYKEALVEVCALQLKFMQDNRANLRLGIPVTPPVSQTKIEDLMGHIIPEEIEAQLAKVAARGGADKPFPSTHTILQLLQSFTGYNAWMGKAARDGNLDSLTAQLTDAMNDDDDDDLDNKVTRVELLLKRGRRSAYHRKFEAMKDDLDAAYKILRENDPVKDLVADDTYARVLEWVGMSRHLRYDLEGALQCYEACSDLEPTNAEILVKRAGVKMDAGKHDEALALFDTALGLDPDSADALLHRANLRMLQQKPTEAMSDLERCLAQRPDHILARLRLATMLMATNDLDGAKKCLDLAESIDSESSEVHSYRGEMHFTQSEFAEARAEFDRAIECDANNPNPYVNAALAVMNTPPSPGQQQPDIPEAVRLLEKAIEVDPQFHPAYVHLGQLKLSMATNLASARDVVALYDRGLEYCRTAEELKDIVSMRILTVAQVEAASALKMETLSMQ